MAKCGKYVAPLKLIHWFYFNRERMQNNHSFNNETESMKIDNVDNEKMKKFLILMHIAMNDYYELDGDITNSAPYMQHQSVQWLNYLTRAENRYIKYLLLLQKSNGYIPLPPTDVLLMWMMHILIDFQGYFEDMFRLFGPTFCLDAILPIDDILRVWSEGNDFHDTESVEAWESMTNEPYKLQGWNSSNMTLPCPNCEADCSVQINEYISFRLGRFIPNIGNRSSQPIIPEPCKGGNPVSPMAGISCIDDVPAIKCPHCQFTFTKETISAKRFVDDLTACMSKSDRFVAGTILHPVTHSLNPSLAKELIYMLFDFKEENVNILFSRVFKNDPWANIQHQLWRLENLFFVRSDLDTFQKYNHVMRHIVKAMPNKYNAISPLSCDLVEIWSTFKYFYQIIWRRFPMLAGLLNKDLSREARMKLLDQLDFGINVGFGSDAGSPLGKSFRSSLLFAKDSFEKSFRMSFFKDHGKPHRNSSLMECSKKSGHRSGHILKAINVVQPLDLESLPPSPVSMHPPVVNGKEIDFDEILMRYHQFLDLVFHKDQSILEAREDLDGSELLARMQFIPDVDILVAYFTHVLDTENYLEYICGSFMTNNEDIWSLSLRLPIEDIKRNVFMTERAWKERYGAGMIMDWQIFK